LFKSVYITRFISGLLLLVFVLGVTPKRFLHDLFAKHIDITSKKRSDIPFQLSKSGYNCDCDNLVAESTFVSNQQIFAFPLFTSFSAYIFGEISFCSISKIYYPLRGPPVNV